MALMDDYSGWLKHSVGSRATYNAYLFTVSKFLDFSNGSIDKMDVIRFLDMQKCSNKGRANGSNKKSSLIRHLCALRSFFKFLKREDEIKYINADSIDDNVNGNDDNGDENEHNGVVKYVNDSDVSKILATCHNIIDRIMIRLLYYCGLRIGELLDVKAGDVLPDGYMRVRSEKKRNGNVKDCVPVDAGTYNLLNSYIHGNNLRNNYRIFKCSRSKIYGKLKRICMAAGVDYYNPHAFRHGRGTELAKRGMPEVYIGRMLRHKWTPKGLYTATDGYIHLQPEDVKKKLAELNIT